MRILIIGRNEVLYDTAIALSGEHTICGIITAKASPEYQKKESDFQKLAKKLKCPFLLAGKIDASALSFIEKCKPDIGVSVNWVSVINNTVLEKIPFGILNSHPSLLPKYRGNAATNWALIMGDRQMGVSIHYMDAGELDSGDIVCQKTFKIKKTTTIQDLNDFWRDVTPGLFLKAVNGLAKKQLTPKKQKGKGLRAYPRLPIDSKINWHLSAEQIDRLVRASTIPYSGAYSYLKIGDQIHKVYVWESRIISKKTKDIGTPGHIIYNDVASGESHVYTGRGILALKKVQYDNNEIIEPGKTWKSIRMRFGIDIEQELIALYKMKKQSS